MSPSACSVTSYRLLYRIDEAHSLVLTERVGHRARAEERRVVLARHQFAQRLGVPADVRRRGRVSLLQEVVEIFTWHDSTQLRVDPLHNIRRRRREPSLRRRRNDR